MESAMPDLDPAALDAAARALTIGLYRRGLLRSIDSHTEDVVSEEAGKALLLTARLATPPRVTPEVLAEAMRAVGLAPSIDRRAKAGFEQGYTREMSVSHVAARLAEHLNGEKS